jgi:PAS domain S-box-containing protein
MVAKLIPLSEPGRSLRRLSLCAAIFWTTATALIMLWFHSERPFLSIIFPVWLVVTGGVWFGLSRLSSRAFQEKCQHQIQQSPAVMLLIDPDSGSITEANAAACRFYGYCREDLLRLSIFDINRAATDVIRQSMAEVINGAACQFQFPHCGADKKVRDVEVYSAPILIGGKRVLHDIVFDITSRLAAERQIHAKRDFAENLLQNSTTPTMVITADHTVLIWNRALEELTGVLSEEVVGTTEHWRAFYPSARNCLADIVLDGKYYEDPEHYSSISRSSLIPDGLHSEGEYSFNNRKCRLLLASAPIRDQDGQIVAAIETLVDNTERLYLEAQLYHAQKMEPIGVLAGGIAHDFNNVLTVISGYADLLKMSLPNDGKNMIIAQEISAAVERAADMTRTLLAFSGEQEIQLQHEDLRQIIVVINKSLGRLIREDIELTINSCQEMLPVFVDRGQIDQVLINLVVNSREAMTSGGRITITTMQKCLAEAHCVGNTGIPPGSYACLQVSDTGVGIAPELLNRIFEPFYTTKQKSGLGLAIVHSIISRHNGHISVTSVQGQGTEVTVYLPMFVGEIPAELDTPRAERTTHETATVLVVEDDEAVMRLHREVLSRYGYVVLMATDGQAGIEMFKAHRNEIRIALVDVVMPHMNGREVVEQIRQLRPDLPIIMTSGYTEDIINRDAIEALEVVFMQKPVKPLDLLDVIGSCLKNEADRSRSAGLP